MSVCALNQAPVPVQEALLQVSGARWAADEMLAAAELSPASADGPWYMTHTLCVCVSDERFWNFPYSNFFFSQSLFYWGVNSNGLWWRRFLFFPKVFSRWDFGKEQPRLLLKEEKKVLLKVYSEMWLMWSWWSVMICLLWVGLLKQSSRLELSDGISYRVIQSPKHRTLHKKSLPNGSGCSGGVCSRWVWIWVSVNV